MCNPLAPPEARIIFPDVPFYCTQAVAMPFQPSTFKQIFVGYMSHRIYQLTSVYHMQEAVYYVLLLLSVYVIKSASVCLLLFPRPRKQQQLQGFACPCRCRKYISRLLMCFSHSLKVLDFPDVWFVRIYKLRVTKNYFSEWRKNKIGKCAKNQIVTVFILYYF